MGRQTAIPIDIAEEQQVAPVPQLPSREHSSLMQMPTPMLLSDLSHVVPDALHSFPLAVHGVPIPWQLPAVVGQLAPAGG